MHSISFKYKQWKTQIKVGKAIESVYLFMCLWTSGAGCGLSFSLCVCVLSSVCWPCFLHRLPSWPHICILCFLEECRFLEGKDHASVVHCRICHCLDQCLACRWPPWLPVTECCVPESYSKRTDLDHTFLRNSSLRLRSWTSTKCPSHVHAPPWSWKLSQSPQTHRRS